MKTNEELNALKEEVETMSRKLAELTEEELVQVSGGVDIGDLGDRIFGQSGFEPVGIVSVPGEFVPIEGGQHQRKP